MWIRTQGGYLLNLDRVNFVRYDGDLTMAFTDGPTHVICEGDITETISSAIRCNVTVLEVRDYVRN